MTLSITCSNCHREFSKIKSELAGKKVRCSCGATLRLPAAEENGSGEGVKNQSAGNRRPRSSRSDEAQPASDNGGRASAFDPTEIHYSDLELILSSKAPADAKFDPASPLPLATQAQRPAQPHPIPIRRPPVKPLAGPSLDREAPCEARLAASKNSTRAGFVVWLVLGSTILSFWYSLFLSTSKLGGSGLSDLSLLSALSDALRPMEVGQFGIESASEGLRLGFLGVGWIIFALALALFGFALIQFFSSAVELLFHWKIFRWGDGISAALAITLVFVFIGLLFLHNLQGQHIARQLNQASSASVDEDPPNVRRLRAQSQAQLQTNTWSIAILALSPAIVFGCSMARLMLRQDESKLL